MTLKNFWSFCLASRHYLKLKVARNSYIWCNSLKYLNKTKQKKYIDFAFCQLSTSNEILYGVHRAQKYEPAHLVRSRGSKPDNLMMPHHVIHDNDDRGMVTDPLIMYRFVRIILEPLHWENDVFKVFLKTFYEYWVFSRRFLFFVKNCERFHSKTSTLTNPKTKHFIDINALGKSSHEYFLIVFSGMQKTFKKSHHGWWCSTNATHI